MKIADGCARSAIQFGILLKLMENALPVVKFMRRRFVLHAVVVVGK